MSETKRPSNIEQRLFKEGESNKELDIKVVQAAEMLEILDRNLGSFDIDPVSGKISYDSPTLEITKPQTVELAKIYQRLMMEYKTKNESLERSMSGGT